MAFLDSSAPMRLPIYEPFVELMLAPMPAFVAAVVFVLQLIVGAALVLNLRPIAWILVGIFLNVNFIMAGAVNPSVFYVVMGMAVVLWIMREQMTPELAYRVSVRATFFAAAAVVVCGPFITTLDPAHVIEDPSLIIICLSSMFAVSCWLMYSQLAEEHGFVPKRTTAGLLLPTAGGASSSTSSTSSVATASSGVSGPPRRSNTSGGRRTRRPATASESSLETDLQELRAASPAEIMEAMDRPIPRLPSKETMSYHEDVDTGFSIRDLSGETVPGDTASGDTLSGSSSTDDRSKSIGNFDVSSSEDPLNWYSVRCHFRVDESHYEERITVWQAVGFDDAIDLAEVEAETYAKQIDGEYLGSCDCFHLPDTGMTASQGSEIYSLVRASDLDPDTYLRTFFFTGSERSAAV